MKFFMIHFLKRQKNSKHLLKLCKNNPYQPQFIPYDVKIVSKMTI